MAFVDADDASLAALDDRELHVPLHLVEELAAVVEVEVRARVRAADEHDRQEVLVHQPVTNRRREATPVLGPPCCNVDRRRAQRPGRSEMYLFLFYLAFLYGFPRFL